MEDVSILPPRGRRNGTSAVNGQPARAPMRTLPGQRLGSGRSEQGDDGKQRGCGQDERVAIDS